METSVLSPLGRTEGVTAMSSLGLKRNSFLFDDLISAPVKDVEPHSKINASAGYREPVVLRVTLKSTSAESGGLKPLQNHLFNQISGSIGQHSWG